MATDLGFHDDELLGFNVDFEKMEAVLKIKTFRWEVDTNPPKSIQKEAKGGECYCAHEDKFVEIVLKLKEDDHFFMCDFRMLIPQTILWVYVDGDIFSMVLVTSTIDCKIIGYEIVEAKESLIERR